MLVNNSVRQQFEERLRRVAKLMDHQFKTRLRRFKLKSFMLQTLQLIENPFIFGKLHAELTSFGVQVRSARKIGDQNTTSITDQLRSNVFVSRRITFHGRDVNTTLVSKSTRADKRRRRSEREV